MTKTEQAHNWGRTFIILLGIVFAGGGYAMKVQSNSSGLQAVEIKAEENEDSIHVLELNARDTQAIYGSISESLTELKSGQKETIRSQRTMKESIIVIETKMKQLEKAE